MASVRFIIGRAGSGKTTHVVDEIVAQLEADPLGPPIFLLVPDQATLLYERLMAERATRGGYVRLQVITFRQLIEWLLDQAGGNAIPEVTPLGRRILIGRLLRRLEPDLTFYRSTARQPGLASRLDDAFAELEGSGRTDADLLTLADQIAAGEPESALPAKLRDLARIYREYERMLGSERLDQQRRQRLALNAIETCAEVPRLRLYVDDFYDFSRIERQLLHRLADAGAGLTIALTVDPADAASLAELPLTHLLRQPTFAFRRLVLSLRERGTPYEVVPLIGRRGVDSSELIHLERHFATTRPGGVQARGAVRFVEAVDRADEANAAARQVLDWVAAGGRFRDIAILARDINEYADDIERSFEEHGIAFFIDRQESAAYQPLIRTVRAVLQLCLSEWQPDRVLDLVKAGLVGVEPDLVDALENYLIAHRIRGSSAWQSEWLFRRSPKRRAERAEDEDAAIAAEREDLIAMNAVRLRLLSAIAPLSGPAEAAQATSGWCQRLCETLDLLGVRESLAHRLSLAERNGDLAGALRQREVWTEFAELLDQLCTVLAGEALTLREFSEVVDVALERFVLSIIPPTIDEVLIGSVDRTRSYDIKSCVLLGLNEGQFPRRATDVDALSDDDRRLLESHNVELHVTQRTALLDEQFLAYIAVTRPTHHLTLVRSVASETGGEASPSSFWTQLRRLIPDAPLERVQRVAEPAQIGSARQLVENLLTWASDDNSIEADEPRRWLTAYALNSALPAIGRAMGAAKAGLRYHNRAALPASVAEALYPSPMRGSATRFETFAQCPFKHFAQHALRLAVREEPELTRAEVGTLYHRVLERLVRRAIELRQDLAAPLPDLQEHIRTLAWSAAGELRDELLLSDGRTQHLIEGVERTLGDVARTQQHALHRGQFRPHETELAFGFEDSSSLAIESPRGRRVELRGKVDRVDTFAGHDRIAAAVIDYKLGGQAANYDRIYHGLSLQLVTYLLVLAALGERWAGVRVEPAAALYVKLARPLQKVDHPRDAPEPGTVEFWLAAAHKARGIIDESFAGSLDRDLQPGESSPAYSIRVLKSGDAVNLRRLDVLNHDAFAGLIDWSRRKIGALADQIASGEIAVNPYRIRTQTPCSTCNFRSVCRLDLAFNNYRWIEPRGDDRLAEMAEGADQ